MDSHWTFRRQGHYPHVGGGVGGGGSKHRGVAHPSFGIVIVKVIDAPGNGRGVRRPPPVALGNDVRSGPARVVVVEVIRARVELKVVALDLQRDTAVGV